LDPRRSAGTARWSSPISTGRTGSRCTPNSPETASGSTSRGLGDINADGLPDIGVAVPGGFFPGVSTIGDLYVIYGAPGLGASGDLAIVLAGWTGCP